MSLVDMMTELRGAVPKLPISFTKTLINRAYRQIREQNLWSFNLFTSSWISPPPIIGQGGVTTTQGLPTILFDATAVAAIATWQAANMYAPFTTQQFRVGSGGIYNLIQYDPIAGTALLDRPFADPSVPDKSFQIYQLYYVPPMIDFLTWLSVRNPVMFINLDTTKTRAWLDATDPQRTWYQFPSKVVPFMIDNRGAGTINASATIGYPLFEMWGQPVTPYSYQCYGIRKGTDLDAPSDTLPYQIGEDLVLAKAYEYAYQWAEANKDMAPRAMGPDFKFLIGKTQAEYKVLLSKYRRQDKEFVDNYFAIAGLTANFVVGAYNTIAGVASPYGQW